MPRFHESQKAAIEHKDGPAMVLAGPGSGKTLVVTHRIKHLIEECGIPPSGILVITFTRAAAQEMKHRFDAICPDGGAVTVGTFHSVYLNILRRSGSLGMPAVADKKRQQELITETLESLGASYEGIGEVITDELAEEIGTVKNDMIDISDYYAKSCASDLFAALYRAYNDRLRAEGLIDFDDMLLLTYRLFKEQPDQLKKWQNRYRYILCDEFQDINRAQYEILKLLALPQNNLFIVGDDDQAIYRFRGARPQIMLGFKDEYPGAAEYILDVNYRSVDTVIMTSANLIGHNKIRYKKDIRGTGKKGQPVVIGTCEDISEETLKILSHIRRLHDEGFAYSDIAVLFRTNMGAYSVAGRLMEYNIPFCTKDTVPTIYENFICEDLCAYLRAAFDGPPGKEDLARIINKPCRYVQRAAFFGTGSAMDMLFAAYEDKPWMLERLNRLQRDLMRLSELCTGDAIAYIRTEIGYDAYLKEYARKRHIDPDDLLYTADMLAEDAAGYARFDEWSARISDYTASVRERSEAGSGKNDGVVLSTMHAAKGLEYRAVFLPDVNETMVPYALGGCRADTEEERRLFYVAMTRAKERLYIYSVRRMRGHSASPSRFVDELKGRK